VPIAWTSGILNFLQTLGPVQAGNSIALPFTYIRVIHHHHHHHHHKHQALDHLARSVSGVTAALASASSVSQLFSFLVDCSGMI
jgi:hypothetical protein